MVALVIIMVADILLTLLFGQIIGPAAFRFSHYGLPGCSALPFTSFVCTLA